MLLYTILVVLIIVAIAAFAWYTFMQWEFTNYNNNKVGLVDPDAGTTSYIAYHTILPPWANDAWLYSYKQWLYFQARYLG